VTCLSNIGLAYSYNGDYENAIANGLKAYELSTKIKPGNNKVNAGLLFGIGTIYQKADMIEEANSYFSKSADMYDAIGNAKNASTVRAQIK